MEEFDFIEDEFNTEYSIASIPQRLLDEGRDEDARKTIDILEGCC